MQTTTSRRCWWICAGASAVLLALVAGLGEAQGPKGSGHRHAGNQSTGGTGHHMGGMSRRGGSMGQRQTMSGMRSSQPMGQMGRHQGMSGGVGQHHGMSKMGMNGQHMPVGQGMGPGMMGKAAMQNISQPMRMRMQMLMDMQVDQHDPAGLLALQDELKLTREQILALRKILTGARKQAAALMTAPQRSKLRDLAKTPDNAREMQKQLMQELQSTQPMPTQGMQGALQNGAGR